MIKLSKAVATIDTLKRLVTNINNKYAAKASLSTVAYSGKYSDIKDTPSSLKNPNSLTISLNGTSQGAYDGSSAKSINITPASIGASATNHTHNELTGMSSIVTIKKTLTLTTDWMDTGIKGADLPSGSYIVQITGMDSSATSLYSEIFTGLMSWYKDITNSDYADEIILHKAGHASNGRTIYLRTLRSGRNTSNPYLRLQICSSVAFTSSSYTFSFRKMI